MPFKQFAIISAYYFIMSICNFVNLTLQKFFISFAKFEFWQYVISLTYNVINLPFHQLIISSTISSTYHFLYLSFDWLYISSTYDFINLPFHQLKTSLTYYFINSTFHQVAISSTYHFVNLSFHQLAILATCHFINLPFWQLAISST